MQIQSARLEPGADPGSKVGEGDPRTGSGFVPSVVRGTSRVWPGPSPEEALMSSLISTAWSGNQATVERDPGWAAWVSRSASCEKHERCSKLVQVSKQQGNRITLTRSRVPFPWFP